MTFTHNDRAYRLVFSYLDVCPDSTEGPFRVTLAELYVAAGEVEGKTLWEIVETASAACAPEDQFQKEIGRQISLRRLGAKICRVEWEDAFSDRLTYIGDRGLRGAVFQAYFSRHRKAA